MQQENLDYLANQTKFLGFGEELKDKLSKALSEGLKERLPYLKVHHALSYGNNKVDYQLNLKKGKENMYFLNSFDAALQKNGDMRNFRVHLNKEDKNITAKEAYNLLEGRSVYRSKVHNKEGSEYTAWVSLDFSNKNEHGQPGVNIFHEKYGYDLAKTLDRFPFTGMDSEESKSRFLQSLEKGNRQVASWDFGGKEEKVFIEANPRYKSINAYDTDGKKLYIPSENQKSTKKEQSSADKKKPVRDIDANPLYNKEGNSFTDELINTIDKGVKSIGKKAVKKQKRSKMKM